jgi:hypothetical protein
MSSLEQQEAAADAFYGFPAGTMGALGMSETTNGQNLGSIGNIFQVLPSTSRQPGYGLSGVNGNDPMSVGAYLSALINGPGGGSVANGLALYQGRPIGSTGNQYMSSFLSGLAGLAGGKQAVTSGTGFSSVGPSSTKNFFGITGDIFLQVLVGLTAIIFIALGVAALVLKTDPIGVFGKVTKGA